MKHIKLFDSYKITNSDNKGDSFNYYFNTNKLEYKISISKYNDGYWSIGFKAKNPEDYFYEHDVIANENPYEIMDTVVKVAKDFYIKKLKEIEELKKVFKNADINEKDFIKGYVFSFTGDKEKNLQRLNLYKRYFNKLGMDTHFSIKDNIFYLEIK